MSKFQPVYDLLAKGFSAISISRVVGLAPSTISNVAMFMKFTEGLGPILPHATAFMLRLRAPVGMSRVEIEDVIQYAHRLAEANATHETKRAYVRGLIDCWCHADSVRSKFYTLGG
jgi:hypothetical protein